MPPREMHDTPNYDYPCRTHRPPGKAPVPTIKHTTESAEVKSGGSTISNGPSGAFSSQIPKFWLTFLVKMSDAAGSGKRGIGPCHPELGRVTAFDRVSHLSIFFDSRVMPHSPLS